MLFADREVRTGKNCSRGLEYESNPYHAKFIVVHICYLPAGRSVLGKTVPEVLRVEE